MLTEAGQIALTALAALAAWGGYRCHVAMRRNRVLDTLEWVATALQDQATCGVVGDQDSASSRLLFNRGQALLQVTHALTYGLPIGVAEHQQHLELLMEMASRPDDVARLTSACGARQKRIRTDLPRAAAAYAALIHQRAQHPLP